MRIHRIVFILFAVVFGMASLVEVGSAQTWEKTFGGPCMDHGHSVRQTHDGGFILAGSVDVSCASYIYDMYLVKTDQNGEELWSNTFGGAGDELAYSVVEAHDGGYIIIGETDSIGAGNSDVYMIKTDKVGNEVWSRTFGGTDWDFAYHIEETDDGGYIIVGNTYSFGAGSIDFYLIKTDKDGNELWSRAYGTSTLDLAMEGHQTDDGGYIIVGQTEVDWVSTDYDVYLVKTDENGNELWSRSYGAANDESGQSVHQTTDGGYIIAGDIWTLSFVDLDFLLIRTDENGNELWSKNFGIYRNDSANSILQTLDGGFIFTGFSEFDAAYRTDLVLVKTNRAGEMLWYERYGGHFWDDGEYLERTDDGGYIVVGTTNSFGAGYDDMYLVYSNPPGVCAAVPGPASPLQSYLILVPVLGLLFLFKICLRRAR